MMKALCLALICLTATPYAAAQQIEFPREAAEDDAALAAAMPGLAEQLIAIHSDSDRDKYLDNLFRLQMVAGQYADANKSLVSLRERCACGSELKRKAGFLVI